MNEAGKGDKDRTTNREAYRKRFEEINWQKPTNEKETNDNRSRLRRDLRRAPVS